MTRWGQVQNTETTNTIHRSNRSNSALSIAPMFNLTTNLLCHKTSQQAATVQQLPSTELCLRIVWLSDGPAPRRWSPVKVSMELWARHMGRHCVVDKIVTFWGREFPFFSALDSWRYLKILKSRQSGEFLCYIPVLRPLMLGVWSWSEVYQGSGYKGYKRPTPSH